MSKLYDKKDNEFIAWYPHTLEADQADSVWQPRRAAFYVHIPFCTAICDYCGFAVAKAKESNQTKYIDAVLQEIGRYATSGRLSNYQFSCGHFGGGTPSAIDAQLLTSVLSEIRSSFNVAERAEITIEVNPISFTSDKASAYQEAGINRVSFGVQSFNDRMLKVIGRPHTAGDIQKTLKIIKEGGWRNYSLDIMYGVPGQTIEDLREDLFHTVDSGAPHISCFRLEIIPFTELKLRESAGLLDSRPSRELLDEMDDLVESILTSNGYRQYGAFNYAKEGFDTVHNEIVFTAPQGEYVGFGNSAYSFMNDYVYCNHAGVEDYEAAVFQSRDPIAYAVKANAKELMSRYFVLGLKMRRVSRDRFVEQFGLEPEQIFGDIICRLIENAMLELEDGYYVLTQVGLKYINNVVKEFFSESNRGVSQHVKQFVPTITPKQIAYYTNLMLRSGPLHIGSDGKQT